MHQGLGHLLGEVLDAELTLGVVPVGQVRQCAERHAEPHPDVATIQTALGAGVGRDLLEDGRVLTTQRKHPVG